MNTQPLHVNVTAAWIKEGLRHGRFLFVQTAIVLSHASHTLINSMSIKVCRNDVVGMWLRDSPKNKVEIKLHTPLTVTGVGMLMLEFSSQHRFIKLISEWNLLQTRTTSGCATAAAWLVRSTDNIQMNYTRLMLSVWNIQSQCTFIYYWITFF